MDCAQELEFHTPEDSGRALDKAKESILLIKKKMFRSHDLIIQYNNKLKECDRLKEDLCSAQEEATKYKRENNINLTKVVKLEMQSAEWKKTRQELERMIMEKDIQIASDKSHLQQLECKLNAVEDKHMEKEMEAELTRSSLEVKTKELEQELRALKKSHLAEINKLERAPKLPKEKKGKKMTEVVKETKETGTNTVEEVIHPKLIKPKTANKMVLTDEFYHIKDNPYPIFCNRCQTSMRPEPKDICKLMPRPPLITKILSPIRPRVPEIRRPNHNDSNNPNSHCLKTIPTDLRRNEMRTEKNFSDTSRVELNYNDTSRVDQFPQNFVSPSPSQLPASTTVHEFQPSSVDIAVPELENLRRKIETLERKIKKQKIRKISESHPPNANCCSHQHPMNYYGPASTHMNPVPNVFPNVQADLMTEFFNKIMNIANKRDNNQETAKVSPRKKDRTLRDKRLKNKLRKLKKMKILKKKSNTKWEIEADECDEANNEERNFDPSDPTKPHLLRIKPSRDCESPVTLFSDTESEKLSPLKYPWKTSCSQTQMETTEYFEKTPEQTNRFESDSNQESVSKVPNIRKLNSRKRGRASLFGDDSEIEVEFVKNEIIEDPQTIIPKNSTGNTRTRSESLRDDENERKSLSVEKVAPEQQNSINSFLHSTIKESNSPLSGRDASDPESCISSRNDEINEAPGNLEIPDESAQTFGKSAIINSDTDQSDISPEIHDYSEPLETTNLKERVEMQKRKSLSSPKATKRTQQSNLLGKIRAIKKITLTPPATTNNSPTIHTTRSLSKRKLTEQSDNDDSVGTTSAGKSSSSVSGDDTPVPMKKQRIAHVPKKAISSQPDDQEIPANSKTSELVDSSNELCKKPDETTTDAIKRLTRRSAIEKFAEIKLKQAQESVKTGKVGRPRGRPPGKRNQASNAQVSLDLKAKELVPVDLNPQSTENQVIDPKDLSKDSESSLEKNEDHDNSVNVLGSPEKEQTSEFESEDSIVQSERKEESSTQSIHAAGASINKTEAARALQVEKLTAADSLASLDEVLVKPAEISILPSQSAVSVSTTSIESKELNENEPCAEISTSTDATTVSLSVDFSTDYTSSATSAENLDDTAQNMDNSDKSKDLSNGQKVNEIISSVIDESPASPPPTENSFTKEISTSLINRDERLSIYDNVTLSVAPEKNPVNFYGVNGENATISNVLTSQDTVNDMPIEIPIERKVVVYDTDLHDYFNDDCDDLDSKDIAKIEFFAETSDGTKRKRTHSGSSIESASVVKELRSRQVLCSPPSSGNPQNLQKILSPSNNESKVGFPSEKRGLRPDSHSGVRSLGTLLNHHLGEQKKKIIVKDTKLRKAAAIKLQGAAEKNVKVELEKLVESEEWTTELHSSVMLRLIDVRSERTVAKCIVDFLLERASLNEPLDRTYTPPAPVMTRTQQRIVTLMNCLNRVETMTHIFDLVQAGLEYNIFKIGAVQSVETVEYVFRIYTVISRLRKDRERVRILCCDALYFLGRRALPGIHVILSVWPEVLPKHGTIGCELPNCLTHIIKQEQLGNNPFPKILALKKMITIYYKYPQIQPLSAVVMTHLIKALHEKYSSDLEIAVLLISKREGPYWALDNVIEKGLMKIVKNDNYQWHFEILNLLGFILRSFPTDHVDSTVKEFVDLLCQMLDSGQGSHDKQEGIIAALLSLSRYKSLFGRIAESVLKWTPSRDLRATTSKQLELFFASHTPEWWNKFYQYRMNVIKK